MEPALANQEQYVTIGIGEEVVAAPVCRVKEILELRPISRLPQAPQNILGVIDVRGQSVVVVDLRTTLGIDPGTDSEDTRIVVLTPSPSHTDMVLGLRVDRVFEVAVLDSEDMEPPPFSGAGCIKGIGRRTGKFVTVLDLDHLLKSELNLAAA